MIATTEGPSALSARRLATQSGTTTAAIYTLFGGMTSLRAALTAQSLRRLADALDGVEELEDPVDQLRAQAAGYREWALAHPNEYRASFTDALGQAVRGTMEPPRSDGGDSFTAPGAYLDSVHDAWQAVLAPLRLTVSRGLSDGVFSGSVEHVGSLAVALLSLLHGAVSLELVGVLDTTLAGLGSPAGTSEFFDGAVGRLIVGLVQGPEVLEDAARSGGRH